VCLLITGSGLKDVRRAQQAVHGSVRVQPTADAVRAALDAHRTPQAMTG
jgi:hypothetical protein